MENNEATKFDKKLEEFGRTLVTISHDIEIIKIHHKHEMEVITTTHMQEMELIRKDVKFLMDFQNAQSQTKNNRNFDWVKSIVMVLFTVVVTLTANHLIVGRKDSSSDAVVSVMQKINDNLDKLNKKVDEK